MGQKSARQTKEIAPAISDQLEYLRLRLALTATRFLIQLLESRRSGAPRVATKYLLVVTGTSVAMLALILTGRAGELAAGAFGILLIALLFLYYLETQEGSREEKFIIRPLRMLFFTVLAAGFATITLFTRQNLMAADLSPARIVALGLASVTYLLLARLIYRRISQIVATRHESKTGRRPYFYALSRQPDFVEIQLNHREELSAARLLKGHRAVLVDPDHPLARGAVDNLLNKLGKETVIFKTADLKEARKGWGDTGMLTELVERAIRENYGRNLWDNLLLLVLVFDRDRVRIFDLGRAEGAEEYRARVRSAMNFANEAIPGEIGGTLEARWWERPLKAQFFSRPAVFLPTSFAILAIYYALSRDPKVALALSGLALTAIEFGLALVTLYRSRFLDQESN